MIRRFLNEIGEAIHRVAIGYDDSEQPQEPESQPNIQPVKSQQALHHELCNLVSTYGMSFGKRHGCWRLLDLGGNAYIVMGAMVMGANAQGL